MAIYVIVNEGGVVRLTRGAIFSYYEFIHPISPRLTDEAWREMLTGETPPAMPEWTASFTDPKETQPDYISYTPDHLYEGCFTLVQSGFKEGYPEKFTLFQNYPNPFNPETTLCFDLPRQTRIELIVYNLLGQQVKVLFAGLKPAGTHRIRWDGRDSMGRLLPSGIYFYQIRADDFKTVRKMSLIR